MQPKNGLICRLGIAALLLLAILAPGASALGVSPGRVQVDFVPGGEFESTACFTPESTTTLKVEAIGFIADYITIEGPDKDGLLEVDGRNGCVKYKVRLPDHVEKPGIQYGGISAVEVPKEVSGNIYAVVRIIHQILVKVPYPGKYLEITGFTAGNVEAGLKVPIDIQVENKGDEEIGSASAAIRIYDHEGRQIGTASGKADGPIPSGQSRSIKAEWSSGSYQSGNYRADVQVAYDEYNNNATTQFKLGGLDILLVRYSENITLGGIKPFTAGVESIWSEDIDNVRADVHVFSKDQAASPLLSFSTVSKRVPAWAAVDLQGFIDTDKLGLGEFNAQINLTFEDQVRQHDAVIKIIEPPKEPVKAPELFTTRNLLVALIVLLLIVLAIVLITLIPKKRKGDGGRPAGPE